MMHLRMQIKKIAYILIAVDVTVDPINYIENIVNFII